jgi:Family of unknown function (DUF6328)
MAKVKDRVKSGLDEGRMLVLGVQVLLGFQYSWVFQKDFDQLPRSSQYLQAIGLGLLLVTLALLTSNAPYHQIAARGRATGDVLRFITATIALALLPLSLGLAIDAYITTEKVAGQVAGLLMGAAVFLVALFFWYGLEVMQKSRHVPHGDAQVSRDGEDKPMQHEKKDPEVQDPGLEDRIDQVLTEARVVLPGAQALLGFQFAVILVEGFDKLPSSSKYVHLGSLGLIALSTILLMTPAAYHRIVEQGEDSEHFQRLASKFVLASMVPLALGICGDFFVVLRKVTGSVEFAGALSAAMLAVIYGLWFGYTLWQRNLHGHPVHRPEYDAHQPEPAD